MATFQVCESTRSGFLFGSALNSLIDSRHPNIPTFFLKIRLGSRSLPGVIQNLFQDGDGQSHHALDLDFAEVVIPSALSKSAGDVKMTMFMYSTVSASNALLLVHQCRDITSHPRFKNLIYVTAMGLISVV